MILGNHTKKYQYLLKKEMRSGKDKSLIDIPPGT